MTRIDIRGQTAVRHLYSPTSSSSADDSLWAQTALPAGCDVSRRRWLQLMAGVGVGAAFTACSKGNLPPRPSRSFRFKGDMGSAPDPSIWTAYDSRDLYGIAPLSKANVSLDGGGNLRLLGQQTETGGFTAARADTKTKYAAPAGSYVEFTASTSTLPGCWPGLFLVGNRIRWPAGGEIDILEVLGNSPEVAKCNLISVDYNTGRKAEYGWPGLDLRLDRAVGVGTWHAWGAQFDAQAVTFYLDRRPIFRVTRESAVGKKRMTWPFGDPANICMTMAVGGLAGNPRSTRWPQEMLVRGVDVWHDGFPF